MFVKKLKAYCNKARYISVLTIIRKHCHRYHHYESIQEAVEPSAGIFPKLFRFCLANKQKNTDDLMITMVERHFEKSNHHQNKYHDNNLIKYN
jgi:hypothetical protein